MPPHLHPALTVDIEVGVSRHQKGVVCVHPLRHVHSPPDPQIAERGRPRQAVELEGASDENPFLGAYKLVEIGEKLGRGRRGGGEGFIGDHATSDTYESAPHQHGRSFGELTMRVAGPCPFLANSWQKSLA